MSELLLELLTLLICAKFEVLLGWNNSRILAGTYYSQSYSRIIGTGLQTCAKIKLMKNLKKKTSMLRRGVTSTYAAAVSANGVATMQSAKRESYDRFTRRVLSLFLL